jgi:hypothetical protein
MYPAVEQACKPLRFQEKRNMRNLFQSGHRFVCQQRDATDQ